MASQPGTQVVYNGVILNNVTTRVWNEDVVRDPSGTEVMYHKFHMEFEAYVHAQSGQQGERDLSGYGPWVEPQSGSISDPVSAMVAIRKALEQPRATLTVWTGGKQLLKCYPCTQQYMRNPDRDVNQGPHPISLQITKISGGKVFRILYSIDCAKVECPNSNGMYVPDVVSNRWSLSEELDENFFVTKVIRGRLRLSQNVTIDPMMYRSMVFPPLETGFRRVRCAMLVEPNGLEAAYEVIDRQVAMSAPWPATQIEGTHSYSTGDGMKMQAECRIRLTGAANCDRGQLIARALQCLDSRLNLYNRAFGNEWVFDGGGFAITVGFGPISWVEVYAKILEVIDAKDTASAKKFYFNHVPESLTRAWTLPPFRGAKGMGARNYNSTQNWQPEPQGFVPNQDASTARGSGSAAASFVMRCMVSDICQTGPRALGNIATGLPQDYATNAGTPAAVVYQTGKIPSDYASPKSVTSKSHSESLYTYTAMEAHYRTHQNKIQLPKAPASSEQEVTAGREKQANAQADEATCVVATVASPTCYRVVKLDAERIGKWPEVPHPLETYTDGKIVGTLVDQKLRPHPPVPAADGSRLIYRLDVEYTYALNRPPTVNESVAIGAPPALRYNASEKEVRFRAADAYSASKLV